MSARHSANILAITILIALTAPGATQEALDVANIPTPAGAYEHRRGDLTQKPSSALQVPIGTGETSDKSLGLSENAWDFDNLQSIPGFGIMPQAYDTRSLRPRFSGE